MPEKKVSINEHRIECPYYKRRTITQILCESFIPKATGAVQSFRHQNLADKHADNFCCGDWLKCSYAKALNLKYDTEGK